MLLLVLQSASYISQYIEQSGKYDHQLTALHQISDIHQLITQLQLHRGLINGFLQGKLDYKQKIQQNEKEINSILKHFHSNRQNPLLKDLEIKIRQLYLQKHEKSVPAYVIFDRHTNIINALINLTHTIAEANAFGTSRHLTLNHMAKMLIEDLLLLQEATGKLRGLTVGLLSQDYITSAQKSQLLSLYIQAKTYGKSPINDTIQKSMNKQYPEIKQKNDLMLYRLDNMLYIVRNTFFPRQMHLVNASHFFKIATDTIDAQHQLYKQIARQYQKTIQHLQTSLYTKIALVTSVMIAVLIGIFYIYAAFYHSVLRSIRKLHEASKLIAAGETKIHLQSDTNDEIGDALLAFNHMSQKLDQNISFLNSYKHAIDEASIVSKTDCRGIITYANDKFCEISGYSKEELLGKPHNIVRDPDTPKNVFKEMWQTIKKGKTWHGIVKNRRKNGGSYIVDATIMPIFDNNRNIVEYIGIRHDVTELEKSKTTIEEEMQKQKIDPLTGLANRIQLIEDLHCLQKPVLLYLNIDDFTKLNDFYGAEAGNNVLKYVASLLQAKVPERIQLYRLQSDEFLLLFEEDQITQTPQNLMDGIIEFIEVQTNSCDPETCISITLTGSITNYQQSDNFENLLSYATLARKIAQKEHRKYLLYSENLNKESNYQNNIKWINKIKKALYEDRITAFFQPIIDNKSGNIHKYEALVRMIEKDGTIVSPFFFLEIAKKAKLYTQITKVMFDKAFEAFMDAPEYDFSINITVEDIEDEEIAAYIFEKLKYFPHPQNVILEITESEEIKDYAQVNAFIKKAKTMGVRIAIDDFGSGYSNFAHIISMDADFIKIDGSLIKNIDQDKEARIITEAIIAFSKKLGTKTVVEFVHNQTIYDIVREIGADYAQGFYLGEPAAEIKSLETAHA